jgi:hypothetical protein
MPLTVEVRGYLLACTESQNVLAQRRSRVALADVARFSLLYDNE